MTTKKPTAGKERGKSKQTSTKNFPFSPAVGISSDDAQFTGEGWEQVKK